MKTEYFELLAEGKYPNVVSEKYLYDENGHQRISPKWARHQEEVELFRRCYVTGMTRAWRDYVEPLQSRVSELEREKKQIIDSYNALSSENKRLEKEVETLREAFREAPVIIPTNTPMVGR